MPVFIDDVTVALPSTASADQVVAKLYEHFQLRDLGSTSWLLGIRDSQRPLESLFDTFTMPVYH
jgi:hypothetical protein